tara:strand:- start:214 stop:396 length:183 start_codon:yes stop_codon:yes gene_type:complete
VIEENHFAELLLAYNATTQDCRFERYEKLLAKFGIFMPNPDNLDENWEKISVTENRKKEN